ncbi:MFS transporter [Avibacterium volantium]|uniref:D-glucarate permease n=1 Tax=Avibacterium volantium TaxID=762 RepID=A0A3S4IBP8_AVIVO|nr:MFS transporter [Avibacterium volantium]VEB22897.1 D-glucarate permease [Avibacterium volantium]
MNNHIPKNNKFHIPAWWITVFMFWLGWIFMYADRTILNPVMGDIQKEFSLSNTQLGLISSAFFFVYAAFQVPSGILGDKIGKKKVLVPGFILFGIFTAVSGWAKNLTMMLFARGITGAGQGTYYGPQFGLSSEQIPEERRSFGAAIINSGMAVGTAAGFIIASWLVYDLGYNWRMPFYVMAVPTVIVGLLILFFVKEKVKEKKEAENIEAPKASIKELIHNKDLLKIYVTVFCSLFGFFVILTWLPYYLQAERGIDGSEIGSISSLVAWVSIPGALLWAKLSDHLGKRKIIAAPLLIAAIISISCIAYLPTTNMVIAAICLYGLVGKLALDPILVAAVADNVKPEQYSSAFGVYNFVGMSSSVVAPTLAGTISDSTGSLASSFYLSAVLLTIGLIAFISIKEKHSTKN